MHPDDRPRGELRTAAALVPVEPGFLDEEPNMVLAELRRLAQDGLQRVARSDDRVLILDTLRETGRESMGFGEWTLDEASGEMYRPLVPLRFLPRGTPVAWVVVRFQCRTVAREFADASG